MEAEDQSKWRLEKTVNLPILMGLATAAFSLITWGNSITHGIEREALRTTALEKAQVQSSIERTQIRTELVQSQGQMRIEMSAQLNKLETEIKQEIRELRNVISRPNK